MNGAAIDMTASDCENGRIVIGSVSAASARATLP
jgi:hypothetical protein